MFIHDFENKKDIEVNECDGLKPVRQVFSKPFGTTLKNGIKLDWQLNGSFVDEEGNTWCEGFLKKMKMEFSFLSG